MNKNQLQSRLDILNGLLNRLSSPEKWTQGWYARTADSFDVYANDKLAVCWCLSGAISAEVESDLGTDYADVTSFLNSLIASKYCDGERFTQNIVEFNDSKTYEEVIALIKDAVTETKTLMENKNEI